MNNEPVAYIDPYDLERLPHYDCYIGSQQLKNGIPLYTHPANELAEDLEGAKLVILRLNATLLQQDYEIQDLAEWKRSLMEVNSQQQAKIIYLEATLELEGIVPNYELFGLLEKAQEK